jgi:PAS domain S-box-containing protein
VHRPLPDPGLALHARDPRDRQPRPLSLRLRWQEITGLPLEQSLGDGWTAAIHPDDRDAVVKEWRRAHRAGVEFTLEFRVLRPDGEQRWIRAHEVPLRAGDGTVLAFFATDEDVSERRRAADALTRSEEAYRRYVDDDLAGMYIAGADGTVLDCNLAAARMLGFSSPGEVIGRNLASFYPDTQEGVRRLTALIERLTETGRLDHYEDELRRRDGSALHVLTTVVAETDSRGILIQARGHILDISERKRLETERERLLDGLTEALRNVKTLSGLLPICASCKKVRDDKGYWQQIETYLRDHSEAEPSHGICPDCRERLYPGLKAR